MANAVVLFILHAVFVVCQSFDINDYKTSVQTVRGRAPLGAFVYYTVSPTDCSITLVLDSDTGDDADLYISAKHDRPTWTFDKHEFQSATCGRERVAISRRTPRPLHVGVYGAVGNGAPDANDTTVGYTMRVFITQRVRAVVTTEFDDLLDDPAALLRELDLSNYDDDDVEKSAGAGGDFVERSLSLLSQIVQVLLHVLVEVL